MKRYSNVNEKICAFASAHTLHLLNWILPFYWFSSEQRNFDRGFEWNPFANIQCEKRAAITVCGVPLAPHVYESNGDGWVCFHSRNRSIHSHAHITLFGSVFLCGLVLCVTWEKLRMSAYTVRVSSMRSCALFINLINILMELLWCGYPRAGYAFKPSLCVS